MQSRWTKSEKELLKPYKAVESYHKEDDNKQGFQRQEELVEVSISIPQAPPTKYVP